MKISDVISFIESKGTWVDWDNTRDIILTGDSNHEVLKIAVCWVATNKVINKAIDNCVDLIITHENPFYNFSTSPNKLVLASIHKKLQLLESNNITVYRCHDVWDKIPNIGVADTWAEQLGFKCNREISSYVQHCTIPPITVKDLAIHVARSLKKSGENGVYVFGDQNKVVKDIGLGTGAATDIFKMLKEECDACIVSDDGINNFYHAQYAIDNNIPLIVVNHANCEILGVKKMVDFLNDEFINLSVEYYDEGYQVNYYLAD